MIKEPQIPLFDLVVSLSNAMDLVSPAVVGHHKRVAYIAFSIGAELGLPIEQQNELVLAGALHDSGAFSLRDRLDTLQFELENPHKHSELGYLLFQSFEPLSNVALLVRYHHVPWNEGGGHEFKGKQVPMGSHLLHLADRIDVLINKQQEVLGQVKGIGERIKESSGKMFMPEMVEAFMRLATKEYFWLDVVSPSIDSILSNRVKLATIELGIESLLSLANLFSHIIDFRSRFTATHSSGIVASAEALARFVGFSERECQMMRIAGYLHDLGKLAVPTEILEKPAKLTEEEFNVIRSHTFHTYRTLEPIGDLNVINAWASFHHERIDGRGYPFHHKGQDLSLGARIMAVADVFTAITEDRPYRKGMTSDRALQVLRQMAENSALDSHIVSLLELHFDEINSLRVAAQEASVEEYQRFLKPLG
ncbi:MAG: 3'3'-cGAMP-specific phosphodiesterase 1 [Firmicutes bacterium]|nr:3'3'-cGAMP-specific phosphodiesterase 1 [Bacillota bacterium]